MNKLYSPIGILCILTSASFSHVAIADSIVGKMQAKKEALRSLITKNSKEQVNELTSTLINIQALEKTEGIPELQRKVRALRAQACKLQQQDPTLHEYQKKIDSINQKLDEETREDRRNIDKLTEEKEGKSKEEKKKLESKLKSLQEKLTKKTKPYQKQLKELNQSIYAHPKMQQLLTQVKPLTKQINEKYTALADRLEPLNKSFSDTLSKINENLKKDAEEVRQIRMSLQKMQREAFEADPCYATNANLETQEDWIEFFI